MNYKCRFLARPKHITENYALQTYFLLNTTDSDPQFQFSFCRWFFEEVEKKLLVNTSRPPAAAASTLEREEEVELTDELNTIVDLALDNDAADIFSHCFHLVDLFNPILRKKIISRIKFDKEMYKRLFDTTNVETNTNRIKLLSNEQAAQVLFFDLKLSDSVMIELIFKACSDFEKALKLLSGRFTIDGLIKSKLWQTASRDQKINFLFFICNNMDPKELEENLNLYTEYRQLGEDFREIARDFSVEQCFNKDQPVHIQFLDLSKIYEGLRSGFVKLKDIPPNITNSLDINQLELSQEDFGLLFTYPCDVIDSDNYLILMRRISALSNEKLKENVHFIIHSPGLFTLFHGDKIRQFEDSILLKMWNFGFFNSLSWDPGKHVFSCLSDAKRII